MKQHVSVTSVCKLTNTTVQGGRYRWYATNTSVGSVGSAVAMVRQRTVRTYHKKIFTWKYNLSQVGRKDCLTYAKTLALFLDKKSWLYFGHTNDKFVWYTGYGTVRTDTSVWYCCDAQNGRFGVVPFVGPLQPL
jgi:hypothetical protein